MTTSAIIGVLLPSGYVQAIACSVRGAPSEIGTEIFNHNNPTFERAWEMTRKGGQLSLAQKPIELARRHFDPVYYRTLKDFEEACTSCEYNYFYLFRNDLEHKDWYVSQSTPKSQNDIQPYWYRLLEVIDEDAPNDLAVVHASLWEQSRHTTLIDFVNNVTVDEELESQPDDQYEHEQG